MGPRPLGRGNQDKLTALFALDQLQWGRGLSAAEM